MAGCKVLCGGFSAKGCVGSIGVVAMLEGIDEGVEVVEAGWQVVDGVELVAPRAVAALHGAIDLGALGREQVELDGALPTGVLELGHELRSAVDLDGVDLEGISLTSLSRKIAAEAAVARWKALATVHLATGS